MAENRIEARLEIIATDQDIDDIMSSAFEGGITYWCDGAEVVGEYLGEFASDQISRGGSIRLHVIEPFEEDGKGRDIKVYELTKKKLLDGIQRTVEFGRISFLEREVAKDRTYTGRMSIDAGEVDAIEADTIIQFALFKDLIYG